MDYLFTLFCFDVDTVAKVTLETLKRDTGASDCGAFKQLQVADLLMKSSSCIIYST